MAATAFSGVLWHLRQAAVRAEGVSCSDGELLDRFRTDRDEAAFAALVRRHGPMVFGVCRRTLRNEGDAEDAFQATFLVLARKAHAINPPGRVGHWLYGVACNTARKARTMNRRRLERERRAGIERLAEEHRPERPDWHEALDIELGRLPVMYREAIVVCDLEGEPLKEAARRLECPPGTVASRLARGRSMLRESLARRGLALSAFLVPGVATASIHSKLVQLTTHAVVGGSISTTVTKLTDGVIQAMFLTKLKTALAAVVVAGTLVAGMGNGTALVRADGDKPAKPVKPGADPVKPAKPANADGNKKVATFKGTLKAIDVDKRTVTITATKGDVHIDRTVSTAKDLKVSIDGREGKLTDLKPGVRVVVKVADDKQTAVAIGSEGPTLVGEFKQVASDKKSITVAVKTDKGSAKVEEKTVKIDDDLSVRISGQKKARLEDLQAGASVAVRLSADGEHAISIMSPAKRTNDGVKKPMRPDATKPVKPEKPSKDKPKPEKPVQRTKSNVEKSTGDKPKPEKPVKR